MHVEGGPEGEAEHRVIELPAQAVGATDLGAGASTGPGDGDRR
jgi:hypothetical protein